MPAAWSFDTMKRYLDALDTLELKALEPNGETKGQGLYKYIETENDKLVTMPEDRSRIWKGTPKRNFATTITKCERHVAGDPAASGGAARHPEPQETS